MKIVLVSPMPPRRDGLADYAHGVRKAYEDSGHAVAAVQDVAPDSRLRDLRTLGSLSLSPLDLARTIRRVLTFRPHLLHVQHTIATYGPRLAALWLLVIVARLRGSFVLVTHHEVTRDIDRLGAAGRWYYRLTGWASDRLHVHTADAAEVLVRQLRVPAAKVVHAPHPVFDLPEAIVGAAELRERHGIGARTLLLQFGFIQVEKGLRELVEAVAVLVARSPHVREQVRVVVAGDVRERPAGLSRFEQADREYLAEVRAAVSRHGLDDVVLFVGGVPSDEVAGWFEAADLVTLPYVNAEQSGVANLAIAAGTPVLSTRISGLGDLFGRLPTIADLDPGPFADALERTIVDPAAARERCLPVYADLRRAASPASVVGVAMDGAVDRAVAGADDGTEAS